MSDNAEADVAYAPQRGEQWIWICGLIHRRHVDALSQSMAQHHRRLFGCSKFLCSGPKCSPGVSFICSSVPLGLPPQTRWEATPTENCRRQHCLCPRLQSVLYSYRISSSTNEQVLGHMVQTFLLLLFLLVGQGLGGGWQGWGGIPLIYKEVLKPEPIPAEQTVRG